MPRKAEYFACSQGYTVFSIPVGIAFRPPAYKIENLEARDYLGKAKVIAATDAADLSTGFASARDARKLRETADAHALRPVASRSQTSAGRLERIERAMATVEAVATRGEISLRRSRTAKPVLASAFALPDAPAMKSTTRSGDTHPFGPSLPKEASPDQATPSGWQNRPPVAAESNPTPVRAHPRSNTTASKRAGLVRSRSLSGRTRTGPSEASYLSPVPSRPPTRPPPLDLGLLRPPGSPGHRRSASSPALLSAELVPLPAAPDAPSRFAQLQKQAAQDYESKGEVAGNVYATRMDATNAGGQGDATEPLSLQSTSIAALRMTSPSIEARDILANARAALNIESPPLGLTESDAVSNHRALARVDTLHLQYDHAGRALQGQSIAPTVYVSDTEGPHSWTAAYSALPMSGREAPAMTMRKIRIKLRWQSEVRAMVRRPDLRSLAFCAGT